MTVKPRFVFLSEWIDWLTEYFIYRPSRIQPAPCRSNFHFECSAQISKTSRNAIDGKHAISAGISGLLTARGPSTVFLEISNFIVDSINRHIGRAFTHIFQKQSERFPAVAKINPLRSVIKIIWVVPISATKLDILPNTISSSLVVASKRMTVNVIGHDDILPAKTTTRFGISTLQRSVQHNQFNAAVATDSACRFSIFRFGRTKHKQSCKTGSNGNSGARHGNDSRYIVLFSCWRAASTARRWRFYMNHSWRQAD